jgi:hypothetical protein
MALHFIGDNKTREDFIKNNKYIFRFVPIDRFFEMLYAKKYPFVSPLSWNDPYEMYFLNSEYEIGDQKHNLTIKKKVFASCLTKISNSEAFWKVYTPNFYGVRIGFETEVFISEFIEKIKNAEIFIGNINYQHTNDLKKIEIDKKRLCKSILNENDLEYQMELLLKKRSAFKYEEEVRIMVLPNKFKKDDNKLLYSFDLLKTAHEFTFDPRMGSDLFNFIKINLKSEFGPKVSQSFLYKEINEKKIIKL